MIDKEVENIVNTRKFEDVNLVQSKNGVEVYSLKRDKNYILKYFEDDRTAFEISCYEHLDGKIPLIGFELISSRAILFEDMTLNKGFRLGESKDLSNQQLVREIALWFKKLHRIGINKFTFLEAANIEFEADKLSELSKRFDNGLFKHIIKYLKPLNDYISSRELVIIHDDFYYKNFFVNELTREVYMFDFNYMKKGLVAQEIQFIKKVLENHEPISSVWFDEAYGEYDKIEYQIVDLYQHISILYSIENASKVPTYAMKTVKLMESEELSRRLLNIIENLKL